MTVINNTFTFTLFTFHFHSFGNAQIKKKAFQPEQMQRDTFFEKKAAIIQNAGKVKKFKQKRH